MPKKFTSKSIKRAAKIEYKNDKEEDKLENLYGENSTSPKIQKPVKNCAWFGLVALLSILFGLAGSIFYSFLFKNDIEDSGSQKVIIEKQEEITITSEEGLVDLIKNINPVVVNFYEKVNNINGPFYQDKYSFGTGFVLTSDGWVATTKKVLDKIGDKEYVILTADYKTYTAEEVLEDPISPVIFVKIAANDLPVVKLGEISQMFSGQKVFGFIAAYPSAKLASLHLADLQTSTLADVVASTEEISHFVSVREGFNPSLIGSPVVNLAGEIMAIVVDEKIALPTAYLKTAISDLSKKEKIDRAYLGVRYINLAKYPRVDLETGKMADKGALLSGLGNLTAVIKNSPADKAGLRVGDIITMVEDELVNGKKTLTQIIQDYNDGETLKLTVLRDNKERVIEVKLGELK